MIYTLHSSFTVDENEKKVTNFCCQKSFFLDKIFIFSLINGCSSWLMKSGIHQKCQLPSLSIINIFNFAMLIEGRGPKKTIFLGNSPKQRTPPTHRYGLGLT